MNESDMELLSKSGGMALSEISDLLAFPPCYALTKEKEFSPAYELAYPQAKRHLCGPPVVVGSDDRVTKFPKSAQHFASLFHSPLARQHSLALTFELSPKFLGECLEIDS
ncbi:hypothetical protein K3495_g7994 [Podosphaera aphanis]|nr:hypothetical protein K3495_g7994 [Podosphaera aphanis]